MGPVLPKKADKTSATAMHYGAPSQDNLTKSFINVLLSETDRTHTQVGICLISLSSHHNTCVP